MKRIILSSLLVVAMLASSCANQSSPLTFEKFYPLGAECKTEEFVGTYYAANGNLDVATGNPFYLVAGLITGVEGFTQTPVQVGDTIIERGNRDQARIRQAVIKYRTSRPVGASLTEYVIPITGSPDADLTVRLQLISPQLAEALVSTLTPANDFSDVIDISVDVQFEGEMTGSRSKVTTATVTFPIRAYKSAPALVCPPGERYRRFALDEMSAAPGCLYAGQTFDQAFVPKSPTCCVDGTEGC